MERPPSWTPPASEQEAFSFASARSFFTAYAERIKYVNHLFEGEAKLGIPQRGTLNFISFHNVNLQMAARALKIEPIKEIPKNARVFDTMDLIISQLDMIADVLLGRSGWEGQP